MKRIGVVLTIICMVGVLTGCGAQEKSLDCNKSLSQNGVDVSQNFLLNFDKSEKFKSAVLTQDMTISDELLETMDLESYKKAFEQTITSQYKNLKYDIQEVGNNKITFKVNFEDINSLGMVSDKEAKASRKDFENAKESFEKAEYTCKVVNK